MATQPSLAMIPTSYKAGKLYSQLPVGGVGDFTVDRNSEATRVNKDGLIEEVGLNVPRLDYSNGSCAELLCEPQSTNLITYSEDFTNSDYLKFQSTILSNVAKSPDGNLTSDKLVGTGNVEQNVKQIESYINGNIYTASIFAKKSELSSFKAICSTVGSFTVNFDLENGVASLDSGSLISFEIVPFLDDWYRCSWTWEATNTITTSNGYWVDLRQPIFTPDAGIYIWGAQLEELSYPTSYIPTNGSEVTRLADSFTGAGDSTTFDNDNLTWVIDVRRIGVGAPSGAALSLSGVSEQIRLHFDEPTPQAIFRDALNGFANIGNAFAFDTNEFLSLALRIDSSTLSVFSNGVQQGVDYTRPNPFDITTLNVNGLGFRVKRILVFKESLSDSQIQTLTTQ